MKNDIMLHVLWVDDMESVDMIKNAKRHNIELSRVGCWEEALPLLCDGKYKQWDAVILDCYCILEKGGVENDRFLKQVLHEMDRIVSQHDVLPWYVLSAGQKDNIHDIIDRDLNNERELWDKEWEPVYYNKLGVFNGKDHVDCLFDNIISWVSENSSTVKLKRRFHEVFGIDRELDNLLLNILPNLEEKNSSNAAVFNEIRKAMDWLMAYCNNAGLLIEKFMGSNLSVCVKELQSWPTKKYVPLDVQQCLSLVEELSQNGSHRMEIDTLVRDGERPFLINSVIYPLLNILTWCKTLPTDEDEQHKLWEEMKPAWDKRHPDRIECYEGKTIVLEKDEMGFLHCGKCKINDNIKLSDGKPITSFVGKMITLDMVVNNTDGNSNKYYPLFAKHITVAEQ